MGNSGREDQTMLSLEIHAGLNTQWRRGGGPSRGKSIWRLARIWRPVFVKWPGQAGVCGGSLSPLQTGAWKTPAGSGEPS